MGVRPNERQLAELIGSIYEAGADPSQWEAPLSRIVEYSGARSASLIHANWHSAGLMFLATHRFDPEYLAVTPHYVPLCPFIQPFVRHARAPEPYVGELYVPERELLRTEYYNDYLQPQEMDHMGGIWVNRQQGGVITNLDLQRPRSLGPFSEEELSLLRLLVHHVRRALQLSLRMIEWEGTYLASAETLNRLPVGAVLLDAAGAILYANPIAEGLLASGDGLLAREGVLGAAEPAEDAALRRITGEAVQTGNGQGLGAGGALAISRAEDRPPLHLLVSPLHRAAPSRLPVPGEACAIVLVAEPEARSGLDEAMLQVLFGLTPAEARLAAALADGQDLDEIAEAFAISRHTARAQLKAAMGKTGTRRQAELVRLLLRSPAAHGPSPAP